MTTRSLCLLSLTFILACSPPADPPVDQSMTEVAVSPEEAVAQVRQVFQEYQDDWNATNLEGVFDVLDEDVVQMGPTDVFLGKAALSASWREHLTENEDLWEPVIDDIRAAGDLVFIVGHFTETSTPHAGGDTGTIGGEGVWIFRHDSLGEWKLVLEQWFARDPGM